MNDFYLRQVALVVRVLPAVVWKRQNLESLKMNDPAKFAIQHDRLQDLLQV